MSNNKPNFHSDLGKAFSADGVTIVFAEGRMVLDFKRTAPRIDQVGGEQNQTLVTEHSPIILQPQAAKALKKVLEKNIENYEEQYGEIEVPDQVTEKEVESVEPDDEHSYIG